MSSAVGSSNQSLALGRNKTERGKEKHVPLQIALFNLKNVFLGYLFLLNEHSNIASLSPENLTSPRSSRGDMFWGLLVIRGWMRLRDAVTVVTSSSRRDVNSFDNLPD